MIPQSIIAKRPSAELAPGQFDDQSLPPYDQLDRVLRLYFEQKATPNEIVATGFEPGLCTTFSTASSRRQMNSNAGNCRRR